MPRNTLVIAALAVVVVTLAADTCRSRGRNAALEAAIDTARAGVVAAEAEATRARQDWAAAQAAYDVARDSTAVLRAQLHVKPTVIRIPGQAAPPETVWVLGPAGDSTPAEVPGAVGDVIRGCDRIVARCKQLRAASDALAATERAVADSLRRENALLTRRPGPPRFGFKEGAIAGGILTLTLRCLLGGC